MMHNHDFINLSLLTIRQAIERDINLCTKSDWLNICSAFKMFTETLITHMNDEDTNCYNKANLNKGCNALFYRLISDHMEIRNLIDGCQLLINLNERTEFSTTFLQLNALIEEHSIREENLMGIDNKDIEASTIKIVELLRNMHINHSS